MITKNILKPGDGLSFPKQGEYVKLELSVFYLDINMQKHFVLEAQTVTTRFKTEESCLIEEIQDLVGEMSLYERCSLEIFKITKTKNEEVLKSFVIYDWLKSVKSENINFEIELIDISNYPY
jgi:hypothetical protein